jgi:uncharacterized membrane protein
MLAWIGVVPALAQPDEEPLLDLSPKQRRALRTIQSRYQGRIQEVQIRLESRRLELAQLLQQDEAEKEAVKGKLDEILDLERERQRLSVDQIFECKGQLNPAQWGPYRRRLLKIFLERRKGGQLPRRGSGLSSP